MTSLAKENESGREEQIRMDCLKAAVEFERELALRREAPSVDRLPHVRARVMLETITAMLLALAVAGMALLGNFLVFNKILHWSF